MLFLDEQKKVLKQIARCSDVTSRASLVLVGA
jgi:hypothetical protein